MDGARMVHRPDIDGLRGIAVLAVLVYHLQPAWLPGGFVGVDVFFVISGYLVTALSVRRVQAGAFSWADFVARRAVRLLPALAVVLLASLAVGSVLLGVDGRAALGMEVAAATFFSSNLLSHWTVDYFSAPAETRPLLHLWSLAIEEQFYLLAPFVFRALGRRPRALAGLVAAGAALSFAAGAVVTARDPSAAFYLLPFRAWELGVGALLALAGGRAPRAGLAEAGLVAIALSVALFGHETDFPGVAALLPVAGAAAVVAGAAGPAGRLLGTAPLQALGRWSYALYLWHWPVVVFARGWLLRAPSPVEAIALGLASVALAAATTRWVEAPLRRLPVGEPAVRRQVLSRAGLASAVLLTAGAGVWAAGGAPVPARARSVGEAEIACAEMPVSLADLRRCRFPAAPAAPPSAAAPRPSLVGWGDSHVGMLSPALQAFAGPLGGGGYVVVRNRCPPLVGLAAGALFAADDACLRHNEAVLAGLLADPPAAVVLGGRWTFHANASAEATRRQLFFLPPPPSVGEMLRRSLRATVAPLRAAGVRVVVVGSVPEADFPVKDAWEQALRFGRARPRGPTLAVHAEKTALAAPALAAVCAESGAVCVEPAAVLCAGGDCALGDDGGAFYTDSNHLTERGVRQLEAVLGAALGVPAGEGAVEGGAR